MFWLPVELKHYVLVDIVHVSVQTCLHCLKILFSLHILIHIGTMKFTYINVFFEYNHVSRTNLKRIILWYWLHMPSYKESLVSNYCSNHSYNIANKYHAVCAS